MIKFSSYSMIKRTLALILLIVFFILVVFGRLFYLQIYNGHSYVKRGLTQWLRDLPLTAQRGEIVDRNGVVLASSYTTYDVYVRPSDIESSERVASLLSRVLQFEYEEVLEKVNKKSFSEVKITKDISKDKVQEILTVVYFLLRIQKEIMNTTICFAKF